MRPRSSVGGAILMTRLQYTNDNVVCVCLFVSANKNAVGRDADNGSAAATVDPSCLRRPSSPRWNCHIRPSRVARADHRPYREQWYLSAAVWTEAECRGSPFKLGPDCSTQHPSHRLCLRRARAQRQSQLHRFLHTRETAASSHQKLGPTRCLSG